MQLEHAGKKESIFGKLTTLNYCFGLNRRRIKMALCAIFSSRFETDNQLIRHTKCAVLIVNWFKLI